MSTEDTAGLLERLAAHRAEEATYFSLGVVTKFCGACGEAWPCDSALAAVALQKAQDLADAERAFDAENNSDDVSNAANARFISARTKLADAIDALLAAFPPAKKENP